MESEEALVRWTELITDNPVNERGFELTQRAIDTGERQVPYEIQLRRKDGGTVWVEFHEAPVLRDGETVAIVGALTDITLRKRMEELLHLELRLGLVLNTAHDVPQILRIRRRDEAQRMARTYQRIEQLDELCARWMRKYANWVVTGNVDGQREV